MHFKNNGDNYFKESIVGDSCIIKSQISLLSYILISSVQFSHSVMSDSLQPHGLQHARLPCHSPSLRVCSNSCPLSRWCHPTISSSVTPSPPALNVSLRWFLYGHIEKVHYFNSPFNHFWYIWTLFFQIIFYKWTQVQIILDDCLPGPSFNQDLDWVVIR